MEKLAGPQMGNIQYGPIRSRFANSGSCKRPSGRNTRRPSRPVTRRESRLRRTNADRSAEDCAEHWRMRSRRPTPKAAPFARGRIPRPQPLSGSARQGGMASPVLACSLFLPGETGLFRPDARLPLGVGTAGALGLVAFLVFAIGSAERTQAASVPMAKIEADRSSVKKEMTRRDSRGRGDNP